MRDMTIKIFLIGLALFVCKAPTLAQNQDADIRCEVGGLNFNLSQDEPGYGFDFGSFSLLADSKKDKEGVVEITKYYKLPHTKLILSAVATYVPNDDEFGTHLALIMFLGKKKILPSPDFDNEKIAKDATNVAFAVYPIRVFGKEVKGLLSTAFLGKKKPVVITMTCKKVGS